MMDYREDKEDNTAHQTHPYELNTSNLLQLYDRDAVQELFSDKDRIKVWNLDNFGDNNIKTTSGMRQKIKQFLNYCFPNDEDKQAITKVLAFPQTQCLYLEHIST